MWGRPIWSPILPFEAGHHCRSLHRVRPATLVAHFAMGDPFPLLLTLPCRASHLGRSLRHGGSIPFLAHFTMWAGHLGRPFYLLGPATTGDPSPSLLTSPCGASHLSHPSHHLRQNPGCYKHHSIDVSKATVIVVVLPAYRMRFMESEHDDATCNE